MANITLGTLRDYWKRVYDAITGPPGTAAPTYAMQVGGSDGTNLRALKTDADGHQQVDVLSLPGVDVTDRAARALGVVTAADGGLTSIGAKADAAVTDPTLSASEIALLKGLLKQLQGTGPVVTPVSLNGSKVETGTQIITNVSVPALAVSQSAWLDLSGWTKIHVTARWDASIKHNGLIWWSNDGSVAHGRDDFYTSDVTLDILKPTPSFEVKARYARVVLMNNDSASAHTVNAWIRKVA